MGCRPLSSEACFGECTEETSISTDLVCALDLQKGLEGKASSEFTKRNENLECDDHGVDDSLTGSFYII